MPTEKTTSGWMDAADNEKRETTTDMELTDAASDIKVHLLDIGRGPQHEYGDCLLCQFGNVSVLIDGGHRGDEELIMGQLKKLLGQTAPVTVTLIITSHPHDDHIGCLTSLVSQGLLKADWALVCDPQYRWGDPGDTDTDFAGLNPRARGITEAVLEHDRTDWDDEELAGFIDAVANLETRYRDMLRQLHEGGTTVVRHATDAELEAQLIQALLPVKLEVFGPTIEHLLECFRLFTGGQTDSINLFDSTPDFDFDSAASVANAYRNLVLGVSDAVPKNRGAINLESLVTFFEFKGRKFIFAGDMQFADPQVESTLLKQGVRKMRQRIKERAPYDFVKLSHHGSFNGFNKRTMADFGASKLYGICCGDAPGDHPNPSVLSLLDKNRENIDWVRTDRNGLVSISFNTSTPNIKLTHGVKDDPTPPKPKPPRHDDFSDSELVTSSARAMLGTGDSGKGSELTFTATVPANATRLAVTLDLQPGSPQLSTGTSVDTSSETGEPVVEVHGADEPPPPGELTPNSGDDVESEPGAADFLNTDADCNVPWRVAKSLLKLRDQVNARAPHRNKASDGTIGDTAHCQRTSDHNPWVKDGSLGVVTALDVTHDPAGDCDANTIAEAIRASRDTRVKYIIWKRRIANSAQIGSNPPWTWRAYTGPNPHTKHVHISVKPDKASYDSTATWSI